MTTFERKAGDTGAEIDARLYIDGQPYNLSTSTVRLIAKRASTGVATSIAATIQSPAVGWVRANITALLTGADLLDLEWEVTDGAAIHTFPSRGFDRLVVDADLD